MNAPLPRIDIINKSDSGDSIDRLILSCIEAGLKLGLNTDDKLSVKAPKDVNVDIIIQHLRNRKSEVETFLLDDRDRSRQLAMGPTRRPEHDTLLSSGQERLWFLFQMEEDKTGYNMFGAFKVTGDFNYQALDSALQAIMFRHQVFRTYVEVYDGQLVSKTAPATPIHIPVDDLTQLGDDEREEAIKDWLQGEAEFEFNIAKYPLSRFRMSKTGPNEHILAICVHHIICDGLSEMILLHELQYWYAAFLLDPKAEVPELKLRYCDFAAWQNKYLGSMRYLKDIAWWRSNLANAPVMLEVPTDMPRDPEGSNAGGWVDFEIEPELTEVLWHIGRDNGTTTFMVGLTLFGLLMRDYSGQDDIVLGTPVSNRNHADLETMVGFFVNAVPLRMEYNREQTFIEALTAVSSRSLESFDRQHVPFEHLINELGVKREASYNPIFQAMFALEDAKDYAAEDSVLNMQPLNDVASETSMFDLDLLLSGHEEGYLTGHFNYNSDLYHRETIEKMVERFKGLIRLVTDNPEITIANLRNADSIDERSVTIGVGPIEDYELSTTIDAIIQNVALENPQTIAIQQDDVSATYGELDVWSSEIATQLKDLNVGPSVMVAVEIPRSIGFLAAILGVLKTGASYVPIDPEYPEDRRHYMVEDSSASVVIGTTSLENTAEVLVEVGEDTLYLTPRDQGVEIAPPLPGKSPVAYMIYTSGSTGKPKGAMVRHDGALNHIYAEAQALSLADDFVMLQTAASSSDISVWQFFGPLVFGGRTVIVPTHTQLDAKLLFDLIRSSEATIVELVPSVVQLLCEYAKTLEPEDRELPKLRWMLITGEAAPVPVVNSWLSLYPDAPMVNAYGPTEAADDVCQAIISEPVDRRARSVSIGKPIANMSLYVLDSDLSPLPIGASGEICVAGIGVGAGYHGLAERTAESFVENPYATGEHDKVLYKTGDTGRWRDDGQLDFTGRVDSQIQLRGFRIELGEVTACIVAEERVKEAATILSKGNNPQLIGYYSLVDDATMDPNELRSHLKSMLPASSLPNMLVPLDELPHLPNGKIDLHNLPRPEMTLSAVVDQSEYSETESIIAGIWAELLGIPAVPLDADFFECGGHSLMAVRLLARVRDHFNKEVSVTSFFSTPTLGDFCAVVDATPVSKDTVFLQAAEKTVYPLSPGQSRLWFLNLFEDDKSTYNMPGAVRIKGRLDLDILNDVMSKLFERHASMRTRIRVENGMPYQEIIPAEPFTIPLLDMSGEEIEDVNAMLKQRIGSLLSNEFNLEEAPLWRFELILVAEDEFYLLNVAHHIITDGISNELLINELITYYIAAQMGVGQEVEPLLYQYGDYSEWQLGLQSTAAYRRQLLYWERKLLGIPSLTNLATDYPRPPTQTYNGNEVTFALKPELITELRGYAQENSATLFMLFQAAMAAILSTYSGQKDIVVGTPIGGRRLAELEAIVGFFVNTVVIRSQIDDKQGFDDLLGNVRNTCIEAFDNSDVPFEQIVERLGTERNASFSPVFQVMVAYQGEEEERGFPGIDVEVIELKEKTAMFDLDVLFDDSGDDGITCTIIYNTDLFMDATIHRMGEHLHNFLVAVMDKPAEPLGLLNLISESEASELNALEVGVEPTWGHEDTIVSSFMACVTQHRDKRAVTDGVSELTYTELDAQTGWLASVLVENSVVSGEFVAIVADRSTEFLSAILGVMRAGAAYVPIDPTYPEGRITHMLSDSAASVLITTASRVSTVLTCAEGEKDYTVLVLPAENAEAKVAELDIPNGCTITVLTQPAEPVAAPAIEILPASPAYMIYTSGSTGKPKGAINTHQGQLNHILAEASLLELGENTVFAQTAPSSSDISVWQFVGPVVLGGTTVIVPTDELIHADQFIDRITDTGINLIELVPALFDHLLDYVDELEDEPRKKVDAALQSLSAAMITGESAPVPTINRWLETVPGVPVINAYGPTEAADDVVQHQIDVPLSQEVRTVPIGRPVPGMSVFILDEKLQRVPKGVRGEICVSGVGVGDGYWRRPELTAETFVANPHSIGEYDKVLYRTGDLGRWNQEGLLEYSGRADGQVNVLGMRIELGEIESAITALTQIKESAVIVTKESPPRIVAFYVSAGTESDEDQLQEQLQQNLPSHMIPKTWVQLDQLPRTPIGKVDYARLALGAAEAAFETKEYIAPESDQELAMTEIWADVLDTEQISVNSDFFDLGGNSLLAVQTTRRIEETFEVTLPLVDFFRQSTVEGVLSTVARLRAEQAAADDELDDIAL